MIHGKVEWGVSLSIKCARELANLLVQRFWIIKRLVAPDKEVLARITHDNIREKFCGSTGDNTWQPPSRYFV